MEPFIDGVLFQEEFPTELGEISVLADVSIQGRTLFLKELSIAPAGLEPVKPGIRLLRGIAGQIIHAALA